MVTQKKEPLRSIIIPNWIHVCNEKNSKTKYFLLAEHFGWNFVHSKLDSNFLQYKRILKRGHFRSCRRVFSEALNILGLLLYNTVDVRRTRKGFLRRLKGIIFASRKWMFSRAVSPDLSSEFYSLYLGSIFKVPSAKDFSKTFFKRRTFSSLHRFSRAIHVELQNYRF